MFGLRVVVEKSEPGHQSGHVAKFPTLAILFVETLCFRETRKLMKSQRKGSEDVCACMHYY